MAILGPRKFKSSEDERKNHTFAFNKLAYHFIDNINSCELLLSTAIHICVFVMHFFIPFISRISNQPINSISIGLFFDMWSVVKHGISSKLLQYP